MMRRVAIGIVTVAAVIGLSRMAAAAGLSYADNQVFPHGYVDYDRAGPLTLADYPFALVGRKIVFQTSYRSLYGIKYLTYNRAASALTRRGAVVGIGAATFGESGYFHQVGLSSFAGYGVGKVRLGGSLSYSRLSFSDDYGYVSAFTTNLGASYTHRQYLVYSVLRSINQPRYYDGDGPLPPEAEIGLSFRSPEGLASQARALFIRYQKPTAQLAQSLRLAEYAQLNWALVLSPVRFGVGLALEKGHFGFEYRFSHHPVLGPTHTINLAAYAD